jgi:SAM-dependent methyltransferase
VRPAAFSTLVLFFALFGGARAIDASAEDLERHQKRPAIRYQHWSGASRDERIPYVENLVLTAKAGSVCEIGAGANPALSPEFLARNPIDYLLIDNSREELAKAPDSYAKVHADITSDAFEPPGRYDVVFSLFLSEHISTPEAFHRNVFDLLEPGGTAFHAFSTLYAPPFLLNRLLPERLSERCLELLKPGREPAGNHAKFPAYYRWCEGPTPRQLRRLEQVGFQVEEYVGFFGHGYFAKFPRVQAAEDRLARFLCKHPLPWLTSYAFVVLHRPG